jgi:ketosteroid isomerase-like protein
MKFLLPGLALLCACVGHAAEIDAIAAVRAVDDARVEATVNVNIAGLASIYSDDLRWAHASGKSDNKAQHLAQLAEKNTLHDKLDYQSRAFRVAGPGVVLESGRMLIHSTSAKGKQVNDVNFLAVWREESGHWKLLDWQAAKNPPVELVDK